VACCPVVVRTATAILGRRRVSAGSVTKIMWGC
jgi:hypothetical protein